LVGKWRKAVVKQEGVSGRMGEWEKEGRKTQDTGHREEVVFIKIPSLLVRRSGSEGGEGPGVGPKKFESEFKSEEILAEEQCPGTDLLPPFFAGRSVPRRTARGVGGVSYT